MTVALNSFLDAPLSAATSDESYELYKAALEFKLSSPIVIRSADDILSAERWKDRVEPFHHQVQNLISFCRLAPSVLLADEVGLGKTISAGLILSELMVRRRVARALVICPKVLCDQWVRELDEKFQIRAEVCVGSDILDSGDRDAQVVVTTYETAARYLPDRDMPIDAFQMLILDEAHRLRNLHGQSAAPKVAQEIRNAIEARWFTYLLMLTATPIQNKFTDIYSLIDLLTLSKGHKNPFGDYKDFRTTFLQARSDGRRLEPKKSAEFRRIINGYIARTRRVDARLAFPDRDVATVLVTLTAGERSFESIIGGFVEQITPLLQSSLGEALMSSPAALAAQLENMSEKNSRLTEAARKVRAIAQTIAVPAKLAKLLVICGKLRAARSDWRVVVFTRRRETQELIRQTLLREEVPVGMIAGGRARENERDKSLFVADPPRVHVLISTDAGAEGVNLQAANVLVNYDMPWNPMVLEQRIGRVQRLGSTHKSVHVINLVAANTVEEKVVSRLVQRLLAVTQTVGDIESILAGLDGDSDDGMSERFETIVRNLVVQSLIGQDAEKDAELRAASIDRAREEYDANCGRMNQDLGSLDASSTFSEPPPKLDKPTPSMTPERFVVRAMIAEGKVHKEVTSGVYELRSSERGAKRFTVNQSAAASAQSDGSTILMIPGQPAFDRLVERWASFRSHRVVDLRGQTEQAASRLAAKWCLTYPGMTFRTCRVRSRKPFVNGRVLVRTTAENRVDQHQQLIEHDATPERHAQYTPTSSASHDILERPVSLQSISEGTLIRVRREVSNNEQVNCFSTYYASRRIAELSRAGGDPHLCQRVEDDFTVTVVAEVVGFRGQCYEEAIVDITFELDGYAYEATLQAVPITGQIIEQPIVEQCAVTGLRMPYGVFGKCDRTDRSVPRHSLMRSDVSGRQALPEYVVKCEVTGKAAIDDEVEKCMSSGRTAISSEFVTCVVTNNRILRSESATSDVSSKIVTKNLLFASERQPHRLGLEIECASCEFSKRRLLIDEIGLSAVSKMAVDTALLVASEKSGRLGLDSETVRCHKTEKLLLKDEAKTCEATGLLVDETLLAYSEHSGLLVLSDLLLPCSVTRRLALPSELEKCDESGDYVLPSELETCAVSGKRVSRKYITYCDITDDWLAPSVAFTSDVSGRHGRPDLARISDKPPHRRGLPDEIAICEISHSKLLVDELNRSSVSNRLIDRSLLVQIEDQLVHPSELVVCEISNETLLPSQVGRCQITQQTVSTRFLTVSEASGRQILTNLSAKCTVTGKLVGRDELQKCGLTGDMVLPSELETCSISRISAIRSRMLRCDCSGAWLTEEVAIFSDVSSRCASPNLLRRSERPPHRVGLIDETGTCEVSGKTLLIDEMSRSAVSNRLIDRELLITIRDQYVHPDELITCEVTGRRLLPTDTEVCAITHMRVACDLLVTSEVSNRRILEKEASRCAATNRLVARDELTPCYISGELVLSTALETCAESGAVAQKKYFVRCEDTGALILHEHSGRSDYRPRIVTRRLLRKSEKPPGRMGTADEFGICSESKAVLLLDEMAKSAVSGELVRLDLLKASDKSQKRALAREMEHCEESGAICLPSEIGVCESSRRRVTSDLLERSQASGRACLKRLFVVCAVTRKRIPQDESEVCEVSSEVVWRDVLETCAATGKRVIPSALHKCTDTGDRVISSEIGYSDYRSRPVRKSLLISSDKPTGRQGTKAEMGRCKVSRKILLLDELEQCDSVKGLVDRDLLTTCTQTQKRILKDAATLCAWTGKRIDANLAATCELTQIDFSARYLDSNFMLTPLAGMLDGKTVLGAQDRPDLIPILQRLGGTILSSIISVQAVESASRKVLAVCIEFQKKTWFSSRRHAGCLLVNSSNMRIYGKLVVGVRTASEWKRESTYDGFYE